MTILTDKEEIVRGVEATKYENIFISTTGRVFVYNSETKVYKEKKPYINKWKGISQGYYRVVIGKYRLLIHVLLAETFLKGQKEGYVVDHIDGNSLNNDLTNLQWVSRAENTRRYWVSASDEAKERAHKRFAEGVRKAHANGNYKAHLDKIHAARRKNNVPANN